MREWLLYGLSGNRIQIALGTYMFLPKELYSLAESRPGLYGGPSSSVPHHNVTYFKKCSVLYAVKCNIRKVFCIVSGTFSFSTMGLVTSTPGPPTRSPFKWTRVLTPETSGECDMKPKEV